MNPFDLSNKVMVITGGTNGIGRGLATYFAKQHVTVAAIGSRPETAAKLQADLAAEGLTVHVYHMDIRQPQQIQPLFDRIVEDLGHIDILVNCAGMGNPIPALEVTQKDWDEMMEDRKSVV